MNSFRQDLFGLIVVFLALIVAGTIPSQSTDDDLTGKHLVPLFPDQVGTYSLNEATPRDDTPLASANYEHEGDGMPIDLALTYGAEATQRYRSLRAQIVRDNEETEEMEVDGQRFIVLKSSKVAAFSHFDGFLVVARIERALVGPGEEVTPSEETLAVFLEAFDTQRLSDWEPPVAVARPDESLANTPDCLDMECFDEYVSSCEPAQIVAPGPSQNMNAVYSVENPTANGQCRISFMLFDSPNSEWEDKPLYFTIDPDESFVEIGRTVISACLEGEGEQHNCEGPLLDVID